MEVKVILVGNGYFGSIYRERIQSSADYELVGVVDPDYENLAGLEALTLGENYDTLAKNIEHDAVVICSPPSTHLSISISAMESGKHVLCAKPGSLSLNDAYYMHGIARANNVALIVDYTMLWAAENPFIGSQMQALGAPESMSSERSVVTGPKDEGIIWDLLCHDVAMYLHQMGSIVPTAVKCRLDNESASVSAHMYCGDEQVAFMTAKYNATYAAKKILLRCKPNDYLTNPRFSIEWDQNQRSVRVESQGKHVEAFFKHKPDPISSCLERFHVVCGGDDQNMDRIFLHYHGFVCRILEAFNQSADNDGVLIKVRA